MSVLSILMGILGTAVLLTIAWFFWAKLSKECSRSGRYILPVHRPQQHRPAVYQPFSLPPPPSQSYRPSPYTPPVHQPEQHRPVYQPPPRPPPPSQSSPHRPPSPRGPLKHEDDNQQDQPNENYNDLRARANKEGDEMARCFSERREAYSRGDRAAAMDLTNRGENHKQKMEQLHKEASDWIYHEKNRDREPGEIDLHGLYVKEAIARTDAALEEAKRRGDSEIRIIVGKGLHSEDGEAKVKPAIEDQMRKHQLVAELDPSNSGVLIVKFNGPPHLNISRHHSSGLHGE